MGEITSPARAKCAWCARDMHEKCEGVCNCDDPSHKRRDNNGSPAATAAEHKPEQETKPQPDDQQGSQPPAPT